MTKGWKMMINKETYEAMERIDKFSIELAIAFIKSQNIIIAELQNDIECQKAEIERLKEPLQKLSEIGYCHNFQLERSDLVSWIYAVCDVIKVAKEMTEGGD